MCIRDRDKATEAEIIALDEAAGTTTKDVQKKANDHRALFYSGCASSSPMFAMVSSATPMTAEMVCEPASNPAASPGL